jgi:thiol-disulfide isomerase/thioredoxin
MLATLLAIVSVIAAQLLPVAVGDPAPALTSLTLEGKPLASRWSDGRATVVMFFATYCQPCHRALGELGAIRQATGPGLRFILVEGGGDPAALQRFVAATPVPEGSTIASDVSGSDRQRWGCPIDPTLFIVDHAGRVRYINHGWGDGTLAKYLRRVRNVLAAP